MTTTSSSRRRPRHLLASLTLVVAVGASAEVRAAPGHEVPPPRVFVFPLLAKGGPDPALVETIDTLFERGAARVGEVEVLAGTSLRAALHVDPLSVVASCSASSVCLAGRAAAAGADLVLMGQARAEGAGVSLLYVTLDARTGVLRRKVVVEVPSVAAAPTVMGTALYGILGITTPGTLAVDAASTDAVDVDGIVLGHGPGSYAVAPGLHVVVIGDVTTRVTVAPGATVALSGRAGSEAAGAVVGAPALFPAALDAHTPAAAVGDGHERRGVSRAAVGATALGAAGLAALVAGGVFAAQYRSSRSSVTADSSQLAAQRAEVDANRAGVRANAAFAVGGVLTLAASVVLGWHLFATPAP